MNEYKKLLMKVRVILFLLVFLEIIIALSFREDGGIAIKIGLSIALFVQIINWIFHYIMLNKEFKENFKN